MQAATLRMTLVSRSRLTSHGSSERTPLADFFSILLEPASITDVPPADQGITYRSIVSERQAATCLRCAFITRGSVLSRAVEDEMGTQDRDE